MARFPNSDEFREQDELPDDPPGASLRMLRERNETAAATVAAHLHLATPILEALERDDYQELPDPVFVRGYIRSYARLFETDADPFVAAYNRVTQTEPGELRPAAPEQAMVGRRRESSLSVILAGLVVVCALGAAAWWWYQPQLSSGEGQTATDTLADTTAGMQPAAVSAEARRPGKTIPDPESTVALSEVTAFDPDRMEMEADAEQYAAEVESAASGLGAESDAAEAQGAALEGIVVQNEEPEAVEDAEAPLPTTALSASPEPVLSPPSTAPVGTEFSEPTLVLAFDADTWVEVRDADRVRKLMGIMKANTEQVVKGRTPFFLTLGNSQGVSVTLNGEPVDHTPYTRGNVARFRLGGTGSGSGME